MNPRGNLAANSTQRIDEGPGGTTCAYGATVYGVNILPISKCACFYLLIITFKWDIILCIPKRLLRLGKSINESRLHFIAVMGGVSILCLLLVLSMCLYVRKVKRTYGMRTLEEGGDSDDDDEDKIEDDDDDDDDEDKKSLKDKKEKSNKKKKKKKKREGFFALLGDGPIKK